MIAGRAEAADQAAAELRDAGVEIVATMPPEALVSAQGAGQVTGVRSAGGALPCDLLVVCGPLVPDAGLLAQAGGQAGVERRIRSIHCGGSARPRHCRGAGRPAPGSDPR